MYITDTDQQVLRFIEQYGSMTIRQAQKMFYNTQKYGYDIARRRMKKLVNYGKIKVARDACGNENVYYMDKKLSYHDLLVLDFYTELVYNGAKIVYFKQCQSWLDRKVISDAYCCYILSNRVFFNIVEVVQTHGVDVEKYDKLYKSGEPQKFNSMIYNKLGGGDINEFPRLVIIDNIKHKEKLNTNNNIKVSQLDFNLSNFSEIFI